MSEELAKTEQYELIESKIIAIRGMQVMLDSDIAELFGVETRNLNKAMKRNLNRFPEDFCFQLNSKEFQNLKFQNGTSNTQHGGVRKLPYVYTDYGIVALAGVLKSEIAAKMSVEIARSFVAMRRFIMQNGDFLLKLAQLQNRQIIFENETNKRFDEVIKMIDKADLPKQVLFYDGEYYDAYDFITSIIREAKKSIILIDPYSDNRALTFLKNKNKDVDVVIFKSSRSKLIQEDIDIFASQYGDIKVFTNNTVHGRFLFL